MNKHVADEADYTSCIIALRMLQGVQYLGNCDLDFTADDIRDWAEEANSPHIRELLEQAAAHLRGEADALPAAPAAQEPRP